MASKLITRMTVLLLQMKLRPERSGLTQVSFFPIPRMLLETHGMLLIATMIGGHSWH